MSFFGAYCSHIVGRPTFCMYLLSTSGPLSSNTWLACMDTQKAALCTQVQVRSASAALDSRMLITVGVDGCVQVGRPPVLSVCG